MTSPKPSGLSNASTPVAAAAPAENPHPLIHDLLTSVLYPAIGTLVSLFFRWATVKLQPSQKSSSDSSPGTGA